MEKLKMQESKMQVWNLRHRMAQKYKVRKRRSGKRRTRNSRVENVGQEMQDRKMCPCIFLHFVAANSSYRICHPVPFYFSAFSCLGYSFNRLCRTYCADACWVSCWCWSATEGLCRPSFSRSSRSRSDVDSSDHEYMNLRLTSP